MNIRYRFNDKPVFMKTFSIEQIERGEVSELISMYGKPLSRDIGTGLKDKMGKEIFERDKGWFNNPKYPSDYSKGIIVFQDSAFWFDDGVSNKDLLSDLDLNGLEIIGREE